jgi:hypothetical protein
MYQNYWLLEVEAVAVYSGKEHTVCVQLEGTVALTNVAEVEPESAQNSGYLEKWRPE